MITKLISQNSVHSTPILHTYLYIYTSLNKRVRYNIGSDIVSSTTGAYNVAARPDTQRRTYSWLSHNIDKVYERFIIYQNNYRKLARQRFVSDNEVYERFIIYQNNYRKLARQRFAPDKKVYERFIIYQNNMEKLLGSSLLHHITQQRRDITQQRSHGWSRSASLLRSPQSNRISSPGARSVWRQKKKVLRVIQLY